MSDVIEDPFKNIDDKREFSELSSTSNVIRFPATDREVHFIELQMNFFNWKFVPIFEVIFPICSPYFRIVK